MPFTWEREALLIRSLFLMGLAVLFACGVSYSQESDGHSAHHAKAPPSWNSGPRRGTNEFGIWGGYSPFSFVLKGTSKDRQLLLLNLQYARTLFSTRLLTLKYTADAVPAAFEFQPTQHYVVDGKVLTNRGGAIFGAGASPIGLQANFGAKRIQPVVTGSLGFLYFDRQVPIVGSSQFNYTITVGFGAQVFLRPGRSLTAGWKYHHLSNNYQAHLNPGIDSGVFYVGLSLFRPKRQE
jgi:hypothetical protein